MDLSQLPDDVLLHVLQLLDEPDVLVCRQVCKRLASLGLHPDVWRRRDIYTHDLWASPVLRLAPCLAKMDVFIYLGSDPTVQTHPLFTTTTCGAVELKVHLEYPSSDRESAYAALIIRNQVALGRLRSLRVSGVCSPVLLETILATSSSLEELNADFDEGEELTDRTTRLHTSASASLKKFHYRVRNGDTEFGIKILANHASTLEDIKLDCLRDSAYAPLLSAMHNLRTLDCPPLPGMQAVAACWSLRAVRLRIDRAKKRTIRDTAEFLRCADQLREVTLDWLMGWNSSAGAEVVAALGPHTEKLVISVDGSAGTGLCPGLQALLRVLPLLQKLQELELRFPGLPAEVLQGITPDTAPRLRCLCLDDIHLAWADYDYVCVHYFLHQPTVREMLQRNPSLTLRGPVDVCDYAECNPCQEGCVEQCGKLVSRVRSYFKHSPLKGD